MLKQLLRKLWKKPPPRFGWSLSYVQRPDLEYGAQWVTAGLRPFLVLENRRGEVVYKLTRTFDRSFGRCPN